MKASAKRCDVLCLAWSSQGRDMEVFGLLCHGLRRLGRSTAVASVFQYRQALHQHRPKLVVVADPAGAKENDIAAQYAAERGHLVASFVSEGNYRDREFETRFWGNRSEKELAENVQLQWSARARDIVLTYFPYLDSKLCVSGAVGFDRYKIFKFADKEHFSRYIGGTTPGRMIGYASWAFDAFEREDRWTEYRYRLYGKEGVARIRQERVLVNHLLHQLIRAFPETTFLIKEHPGVRDASRSEFAGLLNLDNVIHIKNEESIGDCISACDVWLAYESTTALEAWLLGKPTVLINPLGGPAVRNDLYRGSPIVSDLDTLLATLEEQRATGHIAAFQAREAQRSELIRDVIQWDDGCNHLRAARVLSALIDLYGEQRLPHRPGVVETTLYDLWMRYGRWLDPRARFVWRQARFFRDEEVRDYFHRTTLWYEQFACEALSEEFLSINAEFLQKSRLTELVEAPAAADLDLS